MLHAPQSPSGTSTFIHSEDDDRRIEEYQRQNKPAIDRLLELIEQTPAMSGTVTTYSGSRSG